MSPIERRRAYHRRWSAKPKNRAKKRAYALSHREEARVYQKAYRRKNRNRARDCMLQWNYGVTLSWLNEQLKRSKGKCPVCSRKFNSTPGSKPCVDHDHQQGQVRQVICQKCNSVIGLCDESIKILQRVIRYLTRHETKTTNRKKNNE